MVEPQSISLSAIEKLLHKARIDAPPSEVSYELEAIRASYDEYRKFDRNEQNGTTPEGKSRTKNLQEIADLLDSLERKISFIDPPARELVTAYYQENVLRRPKGRSSKLPPLPSIGSDLRALTRIKGAVLSAHGILARGGRPPKISRLVLFTQIAKLFEVLSDSEFNFPDMRQGALGTRFVAACAVLIDNTLTDSDIDGGLREASAELKELREQNSRKPPPANE